MALCDTEWTALSRLRVSASIANLAGQPLTEIPTKNRRVRTLALDDLTAAILRAQVAEVEARAELVRVDLIDDPYVFTDAADGSEPWKPDTVSQYFGRMRKRVGLDHLDFHDLRKFMETYGLEMGYSVTQVAMRAGHDPSIAAKHYSGRVHRNRPSPRQGRGVLTRVAVGDGGVDPCPTLWPSLIGQVRRLPAGRSAPKPDCHRGGSPSPWCGDSSSSPSLTQSPGWGSNIGSSARGPWLIHVSTTRSAPTELASYHRS